MTIACSGLTVLTGLSSCSTETKKASLVGTWQLIAATATENDSTYSTFSPGQNMIKVINDTHFAFLNHPAGGTGDSTQAFSAGGGHYTLADSAYTEHLDYFADKAWEGRSFDFVIEIKGDTLIQKGVERIPERGIDHIIMETYKRVKD
ncbi:hypothetical protein HU175_08705 [Spirosoma sp. KUDC1026]|nr:hypothetical protein HU175_08705 [Spirosoma sp. KUDC1026]